MNLDPRFILKRQPKRQTSRQCDVWRSVCLYPQGPFIPSVIDNTAKLCDDACHSVLIENNGATSEWNCNPFSSHTIDFNENRIASIIVELWQCWLLTLGVFIPLGSKRRCFVYHCEQRLVQWNTYNAAILHLLRTFNIHF